MRTLELESREIVALRSLEPRISLPTDVRNKWAENFKKSPEQMLTGISQAFGPSHIEIEHHTNPYEKMSEWTICIRDTSIRGHAEQIIELNLDCPTTPGKERKATLLNMSTNSQGQGIGKKLAKATLDFVKQNGSKTLECSACNIGSYFWAVVGFIPTYRSWIELRSNLSTHTKNQELPLQTRHELASLLLSHDPKTVYDIANMTHPESPHDSLYDSLKPGQKICINQNWSGTFNFNNPHCVETANKYLGTNFPTTP